jgi:hypothetical protein
MAMNATYRNIVADAGAAVVTHIGLVDDAGVEINGGSYARQPVTWLSATDGVIRPDDDRVFNVPGSTKVGGWRGFDQLAHPGGTNFGGEDLDEEVFNNAGTFTLVASGTGINHTSGT